jgi:hypothetical protein
MNATLEFRFLRSQIVTAALGFSIKNARFDARSEVIGNTPVQRAVAWRIIV